MQCKASQPEYIGSQSEERSGGHVAAVNSCFHTQRGDCHTVVGLHPDDRAIVGVSEARYLAFDANVPGRDVADEAASVLGPPVGEDVLTVEQQRLRKSL